MFTVNVASECLQVIDIMERQSETSSLANGSPPDFDPGPAENGHQDGVSTPEPNLPAVVSFLYHREGITTD